MKKNKFNLSQLKRLLSFYLFVLICLYTPFLSAILVLGSEKKGESIVIEKHSKKPVLVFSEQNSGMKRAKKLKEVSLEDFKVNWHVIYNYKNKGEKNENSFYEFVNWVADKNHHSFEKIYSKKEQKLPLFLVENTLKKRINSNAFVSRIDAPSMVKKNQFYNLFEFTTLNPSAFISGCPITKFHGSQDLYDEFQNHVTLTNYDIQNTEVTQFQWFLITQENPAQYNGKKVCPKTHHKKNKIELCANHPVEQVSKKQVEAFFTKLNSYFSHAASYELPTEGQWAFAAYQAAYGINYCESRTRKLSKSGSNISNSGHRTKKRKFSKRTRLQFHTSPVASFSARGPQSIFDILGNVWEFTKDAYTKSAYRNGKSIFEVQVNPNNEKRDVKVAIRGGSFASLPKQLKIENRAYVDNEEVSSKELGFRIIRNTSE